MQLLKAFKSLKAYKHFFDGYVRNLWVYQCPCDNELMLKVIYFHAYVHHLYNCDAPLEVFVSMNAEMEMFILQSAHVYQGKIYVNIFKCLYSFPV